MKRNAWILLIAVLLVGVTVFQNFSKANEESVLTKEQTDERQAPENQAGKEKVTKEQAPKAGYLAPSFSLKGLDGQTYKVGGERNKTLLINFWASWCGPCHEEADDLVKLHDKYGDTLDIYAVNVTEMELKLEHVKEFAEAYKFEFPVLVDEKDQKTGKYVAEKYNILLYPTSFLVDKNGVIKEVIPRMLLEQDLKRIEDYLK